MWWVHVLRIVPAVSKLKSVPGRLERVIVGQKFTALVDYAHTPDAVERVIETVKSASKGKIIGVLGCGGDRDASKRSLMGQALFNGCDLAVFTSDNPRSESAQAIVKEMTKDLDLGSKGLVESRIDRPAAIVNIDQENRKFITRQPLQNLHHSTPASGA